MPHRRSEYAQERAIVLALAFHDRERSEVVARSCFSMRFFEDGLILVDSRGQGALQ